MSSTASSESGGEESPESTLADGEQDPDTPSFHSLFSKRTIEVVVQSADGTEFFFPRQLIVDASPVLEEKCTALGDEDAITLPEPKEVIETLLQLCHPSVPLPSFPSFDASKPAIHLRWTYQLRGEAEARAVRMLEPWLWLAPVRVFVFAVQNDLSALVKEAARASLLDPDDLEYYDELETISARTYRRLLKYRRACASRLESRWFEVGTVGCKDPKWIWNRCECRYQDSTDAKGQRQRVAKKTAAWFENFHRGLMKTLQECPHPGAIRPGTPGAVGPNSAGYDVHKALFNEFISMPCTSRHIFSRCQGEAWAQLPLYMEKLAELVDERISAVEY